MTDAACLRTATEVAWAPPEQLAMVRKLLGTKSLDDTGLRSL